MSSSNWFVKPLPNKKAKIKLLCFPYAGGNATTYTSWTSWLPDDIELVAMQPPGRASRIFEACISDMNTLINNLLEVFISIIDKPYVILGHSLGSRIAFELTARCKEKGYLLPLHFIASGSRGPHIPVRREFIHQLSDQEFLDELKKLNGTPREVVDNLELMELLLPSIRADFKLAETYTYKGNTIIDCPITVLGGTEDIDITSDDLLSWGKFFNQPVDVHYVKGGHFFIDTNKPMLYKCISNILSQVVDSTIEKTVNKVLI